MDRREFLGWDRPLLALVSEWLLVRREALASMLVVVPTAQSGRRLRERLAEAGGVLGPRVVTPAFFLEARRAAPAGPELVAWVEVLEAVADWKEFAGAFPRPPGEGEERGWAVALARSLAELRRHLQEAGMTIAMAAGRLKEGIEAERWSALAGLERRVERTLGGWGWRSKSVALADDRLVLPGDVEKVVVAGVCDPWPVVVRRWQELEVPVTILVGGPREAGVDEWGRPREEEWLEGEFSWPDGERGSVQLGADPRQQAELAKQTVARNGESSEEVALGSADEEVAGELVRVFGRSGWKVFDPGGAAGELGLARWFALWRRWLVEPHLRAVADLLGRSETGVLVRGRRAQKARTLTLVRDRWLAARSEDIRRLLEGDRIREREREGVEELAAGVEALEGWRERFLRESFVRGMATLVPILARTGERAAEEAETLLEFVDEVREVEKQVERDPIVWIEVMLASLPVRRRPPPAERMLDVLGWLELPFEPGRHLVLAGMNEGKVPARAGGEPWLGETARTALGLMTDAQRAARDAFLLHALVEARRDGGRVDLICGKTSAGGDVLLPSRLLLAASNEELPGRVELLFRSLEPPDAGLCWEADFQWRPPRLAGPERLSVTAFRDYLACPFRFYLKQVVRMQPCEVERGEWNARDFGTVIHDLLERWGRDEEARDYAKREPLEEWLNAELDGLVAEWFGARLPLAVAIQVEGMRQRLAWFAQMQACERAEGWMVKTVEREIACDLGGLRMTGKVDRIDRHEDGRWRVLDYKTGSIKSVEGEHRTQVTAATRLPQHMEGDERLLAVRSDGKGKETRLVWRNLQLPLYLAGLRRMGDDFGRKAEAGYFLLGSTQAGVGVACWEGFCGEDVASAERCAEAVAERVRAGVFWPPEGRSAYRDFDELAMGRKLEQTVAEPEDWRP